MTREELIETILEVFDDTYSAGVFGKEKQNLKQAKLVHLARQLKKHRKSLYFDAPKARFAKRLAAKQKHWRAGNYALEA